MNLQEIGNLVEAGLWSVIALLLLVGSWRSAGQLRRVFALLGFAFLLFGVSDGIEAQTGAWWRPIWLLLLKGACLAAIVYGFREHFRLTKRPGAPQKREDTSDPAAAGGRSPLDSE